jgi:hypothetical protein
MAELTCKSCRVLQESARRTFLMIFFFVRTCHLIKGQVLFEEHGPCDGKLGLYHSFTLSSHLWTAKDPVDFSTAWRTKKHFVVKNAEYVASHCQPMRSKTANFGFDTASPRSWPRRKPMIWMSTAGCLFLPLLGLSRPRAG